LLANVDPLGLSDGEGGASGVDNNAGAEGAPADSNMANGGTDSKIQSNDEPRAVQQFQSTTAELERGRGDPTGSAGGARQSRSNNAGATASAGPP